MKMNEKEKQSFDEQPISEFDLQKVLNKFNMSDYNEDFVITNNILKYHMKSIEVYNYEKNKIYDKSELDLYKEKLINKDNVHYYPYELYFNTYKNIYKEDKMLLSIPNNIKKTKEKENDEKEEEQEDKEKEDNASNIFEEEQGSEDDYNFDYNKSEDELDNDDNDENVI
ncbi:conserved Plasmodium protein, unknown function [Plasmodium gallinaceum]|uniref:Uncharacterized protein n=1 Tax=Plasmodium gallinaceum TaxID=5849 RepID=A0A1J1GR06_PLAGA|nr:conserved Plasmodium protein, unknown function [Plasmodium gallinaceum]CRG94900.1 conserved Plasmodium protein, unknown function [Plasmodium gallinaceum]